MGMGRVDARGKCRTKSTRMAMRKEDWRKSRVRAECMLSQHLRRCRRPLRLG